MVSYDAAQATPEAIAAKINGLGYRVGGTRSRQ